MKINKYRGILVKGIDIKEKRFNTKLFTEEQLVQIENIINQYLEAYDKTLEKYYLIIRSGKLKNIKLVAIERTVPKSIRVPKVGRFNVYKEELIDGTTEYLLTRNFDYDNILFAKSSKKARTPKRERGNAGFDFWGCLPKDKTELRLEPFTTTLVPTGISVILPDGFYLHIAERGSTGVRGLKYSAGVIDNNYRGEIFIPIFNANFYPVILTENSELHDLEVNGCKHYSLDKAIAQGIPRKYYEDLGINEISKETFERIVNDEKEEAEKNNQYFRGDKNLGSSNNNNK